MNICIITVYNTENCGSFWQARALASVLEKMGHSVSFLYRDMRNTSQSFKENVRVMLVKSAKLQFKSAAMVWKRMKNYKKAQICFPVITKDSEEFKNIDYFVIGSDTIWNFKEAYFMNSCGLYTGKDLGPEKCITYAASAANTPYEIFNVPKIKEPIGKLKAISVRDSETNDIVKQLIGRDAVIVCDPTMLTERELFDSHTKEIDDENYILLYHFAPIDEKAKNEILELKQKHNMRVISFGAHRSWCDKTIAYDPYVFLSYFKNASFVVTDTFHGTIFSILNEKNFAEYGNRKKKIADLLKALQLTAAVKDDNISLADMYDKGLDYSFANEEVKRLRKKSMKYLEENLTEN